MKIMFAGDVVLNDSTWNGCLVEPDLHNLILETDVACCNLEGCIEKENLTPIHKRGPNIKNGALCLKRLKESGFNMVTLANNHIMDYGVNGLAHTINALGTEFYHIGAGSELNSIYKLQKVSIEEYTIGFISVSEGQFRVGGEGRPGVAWMFDRNTWCLLKQAKEECNYFFVICHCGAEELIVPLPEVRELYRAFIDEGASAVFGHHPHVIQGFEEYNGKKIFYSLGNFAFDIEGSKIPYNPVGLCVFLEIENGRFFYEPVVTEYRQGKIGISEKYDMLYRANIALESEEKYKKCVEKYCISSYYNDFRRYYAAIVGLDITNRDKMCKFAHHRLNGDEIIWDDLFLYHNIGIETNRWICQRAIKLLGYLGGNEDVCE